MLILMHMVTKKTLDDPTFLKRTKNCHVYFARSSDYVKIGFTRGSVQSRVRAIHYASPSNVELLGSIPGSNWLERALHFQFRHLRVKGEWFQFAEDIQHFLDEYVHGTKQFTGYEVPDTFISCADELMPAFIKLQVSSNHDGGITCLFCSLPDCEQKILGTSRVGIHDACVEKFT